MPSIGMALGGGGVRGLAHVGLLNVFKREGIPIKAIAGSSMGAIVGATYALKKELFLQIMADLASTLPARLSAVQANQQSFLERLRQFIDVERFLVDTLWGWGILPETVAADSLASLTLGKNLEQADTPIAVITTDLRTEKKIVFREGLASLALQASSAIPGFFPPVEYQGMLLADGAIVDFVPVAEARKMGVDYVIAVDVDQQAEPVEIRNGLEAFLRAMDICSRHHKRHHLQQADLVIRTDFGEPVSTFEVAKAELCIRAGERAAEQVLPEVKRLLTIKRKGARL